MDDKKEKEEGLFALGGTPGSSSPGGTPGSPSRSLDPRPTDLQVFFMILPGILGGAATKQSDITSALSTAFIFARQALGQCVMMGTVRSSFICNDRSTLAMLPNNQSAPGVQAPISQQQANGNGVMVAQYSNVPGQGQPPVQPSGVGTGGMVSQYPNREPPVQHGGAPSGLGAGDGSRGVMVAQFPNGTTPPQI
jgi:hypothetical protein